MVQTIQEAASQVEIAQEAATWVGVSQTVRQRKYYFDYCSWKWKLDERGNG